MVSLRNGVVFRVLVLGLKITWDLEPGIWDFLSVVFATETRFALCCAEPCILWI